MAQFSAYEPPKWDTYKEIIAELYEKNELKDVKRIMKDCYNFKASWVYFNAERTV
ncbi:hypothetical protein EJ04DRAFT_512097 [Polyplosphaeria fusca]|uniref:Clr5 domain-containing protein n=1 Tax=Polyplosphaeria fusca TaxID=682080 RepID=A0A9P4V1V6_9PLEO|nr:hypothetical protein EJ04DRAFT_512097 [Polyplosphaeria fusca]